MPMIYEGQIAVAGDGYTHFVWNDDREDVVEVEIDREALDARVTERARLELTLDYPFEKPFHAEVRAEGGATLRQIIDAIRNAYRLIYRDTVAEPMEEFDNMRVRGAYGEAMHVIEDLVIESIELDEESGRLEVFIGS